MNDRQAHAALHAPVAPDTWSFSAALLRTVERTGVIPVKFSRPVEIVGFAADVIPARPLVGGGLAIPTPADIDALVEMDNGNRKFTSRVTDDGTTTHDVVPLSHLTVLLPRLVRIEPDDNPNPDFSFQFAWAQFVTGVPKYEDAIIRFSLLGSYLHRRGQP